jgi:hypothetical protein
MRTKHLIHDPSEIPKFTNEDEEDAFWDTHSFADDFPLPREPLTSRTAQRLRRYREQNVETPQHDG